MMLNLSVIRLSDENGFEHILSVSNFYEIVIEEIKE